MERFHIVEDAAVILRSRGVYKQAKVFLRGNGVYAGVGGGFVRLYANGITGSPTLLWDDIEIEGASALDLVPDALGKLSYAGAPKQIEGATT